MSEKIIKINKKNNPEKNFFRIIFYINQYYFTKPLQTDYYKAQHRIHFSLVIPRDFHFQ